MNSWTKAAIVALSVTMACPASARQNSDELGQKMLEAEQRLLENEASQTEADRDREAQMADRERARAEALREMERVRAELERVMQDESIEIEVRMRAAEASMAEAAQHVAELSRRRMPEVARIERIIRSGHGPVMGITIGADEDNVPVEGVTIQGVSPGGAADESGLRAGDVITSINGESLTAGSDSAANKVLLDFMEGVENGDELTIEYLRNGKALTTDLKPRQMHSSVFAFEFDDKDFSTPGFDAVPGSEAFNNYIWVSGGNGLGDMEIVPLTERLGSYFGTDEGLLIVRAPTNDQLQLQDGDVLQSIDGRKPTSVNHAMRILGSYQSGESVKLQIMRDKRKQTISVVVPDNRQSGMLAPSAPFAPAAVVAPTSAVAPSVTVIPKVRVVTVPREPN